MQSALTFMGLEARPDVARRRMQTRQNRILEKGDIMKSRDTVQWWTEFENVVVITFSE
jgi:hypothetical protein